MITLHRIRSAITMIITGRWKEFWWRWEQFWWDEKMSVRGINLERMSEDELGLSTELYCCHSITPGPHLEKVLDELSIRPDDRILDIGCGKGAALITMAKFPFARIAGCEISPELVDIARENLKKLHLPRVELFNADATTFTDLDDYNYVYFFNPFKSEIFTAVMKNIYASLERKQRQITIIYRNPEAHQTVMAEGIFHKVREMRFGSLPFYIYSNLL